MKALRQIAVLVLAPLLLAGCTSSPGGQEVQLTTQYGGVGPLLTDPTFDGIGVPVMSWLGASRETVSLTTWGSGSCPSIPVEIRVVSPTEVTLTMKTYSGACTSDLAPHTSEFTIPGSVSRTRPIAFSLDTPGGGAAQKATLSLPAGQDVPVS